MKRFTWWNRALFGLLAAGLLTPLVTRVPDTFHPPLLIVATTVACVATALAIGRRGSSR